MKLAYWVKKLDLKDRFRRILARLFLPTVILTIIILLLANLIITERDREIIRGELELLVFNIKYTGVYTAPRIEEYFCYKDVVNSNYSDRLLAFKIDMYSMSPRTEVTLEKLTSRFEGYRECLDSYKVNNSREKAKECVVRVKGTELEVVDGISRMKAELQVCEKTIGTIKRFYLFGRELFESESSEPYEPKKIF